jgi:hypothetical protein
MSRHRVSSLELLLGLFGSAIGGLIWLCGYIWRTYNKTFDESGNETQQGSDSE